MRTTALLVLLLLAPVVSSQDKQEVLDAKELAARQEEVTKRLKRLEDKMKDISKLMLQTDPERAARLEMAWKRSKADGNTDRMKEIEELLKEEHFTHALTQQKEMEAALNRLLDILLDRDAERKELQEKIDKLERVNEQLGRIIEQERGHFQKTDKFANPEKTLQRAAAARAKLSDLIARQQKLIDKTKEPGEQPGLSELKGLLEALRRKQADLRERNDPANQAELAKDAADLAAKIAGAAQGLPDSVKRGALGAGNPAEQASRATERAAGAMKDAAARMQGGTPFGDRQSDAERDLREAAEALERLAERARKQAAEDLKASQERVRKDTERLRKELERLQKGTPGADSGAGQLGKAGGQMEQAGKRLGQGRRSEALPHEEEAKRELERAKKQLEEYEKELKRLIELPDYEKLAKEQEKTTEDTEDLLKKMKPRGGGGQPQDGQGEPTPGQGGVEGAKKAMDRAGRNLRGKSARDANRDQQEAIERLEKAREELEEALRQMREEEQLMLLDALERRLSRMLSSQRQIFKSTVSLSIRLKEAKKPARVDIDTGRKLGDGEAELAVEAEKILDILREEGTTIVIPDVVEDLRKDLDGLAARLRKLLAGSYTQQVQQDVIDTIKELLEVIEQERQRRQGGGQGNNDPMEGDSADESLLPTSAELKMLRSLQLRVNRRTERYGRLVEKDEEEVSRLSEKQGAVGSLTRSMADKLNREEE